MEKTDAQLAREAGQGDSDAFGVLVERHCAALIGYGVVLLGAREDAEDLAQETFLRAWQEAPSLRNPAAIGAWLHRIAHNLAVSRGRRLRPAPLIGDPPGREPSGCGEERRAAVLAAIGKLSEPHREVIERKHFGGYTQEQIAGQLGVPPGTVRSRLARAYGELRAMLAKESLT